MDTWCRRCGTDTCQASLLRLESLKRIYGTLNTELQNNKKKKYTDRKIMMPIEHERVMMMMMIMKIETQNTKADDDDDDDDEDEKTKHQQFATLFVLCSAGKGSYCC